ncbi:DinB family protein [Pseudonocardia spinosispora]|uniref:DinB family protein n=1 Tax=Pseudonocardia spinosispora TaxID=103441 RepID=UPI000426FACC|nr:DinB family protein [Pseudonocardia spinosispora]
MPTESPEQITPDDRDWTWVLDRPCPECGLDVRSVGCEEVAQRLRANSAQWLPVLRRRDVALRPDPATWSPLEYACHVRDVFRIYDRRLQLMLTEHDPLYPNWDQDRTAIQDRYHEQEPSVVATELTAAGQRLAQRFDAVRGEEWSRPGRRSDGASFTVDTFSRYLLHDPVHHLHDVTSRPVAS